MLSVDVCRVCRGKHKLPHKSNNCPPGYWACSTGGYVKEDSDLFPDCPSLFEHSVFNSVNIDKTATKKS